MKKDIFKVGAILLSLSLFLFALIGLFNTVNFIVGIPDLEYCKITDVKDVELRSENCEGGKGGFANEIMWNQDIYLNGELLPKPYNFQCIK